MVPAIVASFLFLPTGLAAVVYAAQAGTRQELGDAEGAAARAAKARLWALVSLVVAVVLWVLVAFLLGGSDPGTRTEELPML
ncbi:CD225/dispanin family protein [Streptomyces sp. WAC06614]|nr:CD225/dispanin family protein [Streptomyces sp. WAC06614]